VQAPNTFIFETRYGFPNIKGKVLWWITWKEGPHHEIKSNSISHSHIQNYSHHTPPILLQLSAKYWGSLASHRQTSQLPHELNMCAWIA
jgi:hypothetical protein